LKEIVAGVAGKFLEKPATVLTVRESETAEEYCFRQQKILAEIYSVKD
jgi:hypothetical protein